MNPYKFLMDNFDEAEGILQQLWYESFYVTKGYARYIPDATLITCLAIRWMDVNGKEETTIVPGYEWVE